MRLSAALWIYHEIFSIINIISFFGCTGHYAPDEFDLAKAIEALKYLKEISASYMHQVPDEKWPEYLKEIGAKNVFIGKDCVFIEIDRFFVDESGLFSPFKETFIANIADFI